jgi:hypothetical protein
LVIRFVGTRWVITIVIRGRVTTTGATATVEGTDEAATAMTIETIDAGIPGIGVA